MLKQIINQDADAAKGNEANAQPPAGNQPAKGNPRQSGMHGSKNILSSDVEIKGTLKFANELIIDGRIEGEVTSEGDLTVGENANVQADIKTRSVIVFGKVHGNITVTDRCELKQNAELHGDVTAGKLAIEEGATFMGSSTVGAAAKRAAASANSDSGPKLGASAQPQQSQQSQQSQPQPSQGSSQPSSGGPK